MKGITLKLPIYVPIYHLLHTHLIPASISTIALYHFLFKLLAEYF